MLNGAQLGKHAADFRAEAMCGGMRRKNRVLVSSNFPGEFLPAPVARRISAVLPEVWQRFAGKWATSHPQAHVNVLSYSHRSAAMGSTFAARRAGIQQAIAAARETTVIEIASMVAGLVSRPTTMPLSIRNRIKVSPIPIASPRKTAVKPCRKISRWTLLGLAPKAMRTPISWVRHDVA